MKVILLTIVAGLLLQAGHAKNIAVLGGASGECLDRAKGQDYMETDTRFMSGALKKLGWETTTFVNNPKEGEGDMILESFLQSLDQAEQGDQLLINFNTHGSREDEGFNGPKRAMHGLCFQGRGGEQVWVSMNTIKDKIQKLSAKGVKIAVLDSSCYGGGAIAPLAGENVCVVSGTPSNLTNQGNDVSVSMIAQLAASRLSKAEQDQLFKDYPVSQLKNLRGNIKKNGMAVDVAPSDGISLENLFMNARTFGAFGHEHQPAQISSDVGGHGQRLGNNLSPLAMAPEVFVSHDRILKTGHSAEMLEAILLANRTAAGSERIFYDQNSCATPDNPFGQIEPFIEQIKGILAQKELKKEVPTSEELQLLANIKRLGFKDLADVQARMRKYTSERVRLYHKIKTIAAKIQEFDEFKLPSGKLPPDLAKLRKAELKNLEKAYAEHGLLNRDDLPQRLEKAYYLAHYVGQRPSVRDDEKVKACESFKF